MASIDKKSAILMTIGSFLVVLGAVLVVFWPALYFSQLRRLMVLTETSMSFGIWRNIPIPMYLECFFFNVSNADEILSGKAVNLKLEQMGPYVYRQYQTKENITFNNNNTVTFYNKKVWHFEPEMSNGSLSDLITNVNPVIVTVAYFLRHQHPLLKIPVDVFMRMYHDNMFTTANVSSWLFDGIDDPVLEIVARFPDLPFSIPYDKFGWFYTRNGSLEFDGVFVMNTGSADFSELGNVELWNGSNQTMYRDECGAVRGSTGELWAPELGQPDVTIFVPDICTYLTLSENETTTISGIEGVTYMANDSIFDNGYRYPSKACYCDEVRDNNCLPPGALNVSSCRFGAPAVVTQPHFYQMDPYYAQKIDGLVPTDKMNMHLTLEMYTGMPLGVAAQLQINLLVRHIEAITINNQLHDPDVLVPMFWFRQEMEITQEYADMARFAINIRYGMPYGLYALTVIGVVVLVLGVYYLMKKLLRSTETTPILEDVSEDQ